MSLDNLDQYLTVDPADRETCEEHGQCKPCKACLVERWEIMTDAKMEERDE